MKSFFKAAAVFCSMFLAVLAFPYTASYIPSDNHSVLVIYADDNKFGSGVYLQNNYVLTAAHVVYRKELTYSVSDKEGNRRKAEVVYLDRNYDFAILRISSGIGYQPSEMSCEPLWVDQKVTVKGHPGLLNFLKTRGVVAGSPIEIRNQWRRVVPVDVTASFGSSGGPVFYRNEIVGIVVGGSRAVPGVALVTPSEVFCNVLSEIN